MRLSLPNRDTTPLVSTTAKEISVLAFVMRLPERHHWFPWTVQWQQLGYRFARYNDAEKGMTSPLATSTTNLATAVLRSYELKLGIDNALDGFACVETHFRRSMIDLRQQRLDFQDGLINGPGIIRAADTSLMSMPSSTNGKTKRPKSP